MRPQPAPRCTCWKRESSSAPCFSCADPTHVIFTPGQTYSLNMVIKGYLHPGDHALVSR